MPTAVLIDTVSIQAYIFGSNKLKENIGASHIIEHWIYPRMIPKALDAAGFKEGLQVDEWKSKPEDFYKLEQDEEARVEIGYIGGGNALILFRDIKDAQLFIRTYSKLVLQYFPGIRTAFAIGPLDYEAEFAQQRRELNDQLVQNKNRYFINATPFKHGVVEDCPLSNEGQEVDFDKNTTNISYSSYVRLKAAEESQKLLAKQYAPTLGSRYTFTTELEELGQPEEKSYIAIVHADGNGMGERFIKCNSLADVRTLSKGVADLASQTMEKLIAHVVELFNNKLKKEENGFRLFGKKNNGKLKLPIRPIISGGDDITFVCEGRLGVYLAEKLLEFMTKIPVASKEISACAGVSIVHTKYPFYRAYRLSEELIKKAKEVSRAKNDSWINFLISSGGFSGSLDDILQQQYSRPDSKLLLTMAPYKFGTGENSLQELKKGIEVLSAKWPRNKQKALRDILRKDEVSKQYFLAELEARGLSLPKFKGGKYDETIWDNHTTPYFDMVELMDFYPKTLLAENKL